MTSDHIDRGEVLNAARCPVALAVAEHIDPRYCVEATEPDIEVVVKDLTSISDGALWQIAVPTPEVARTAIVAFDNGRKVEPVSFDLELPKVVLQPL